MSDQQTEDTPLDQALALIEQLECKIAFQEDTIEQLNQVVTHHQQCIDRMEQGIERLTERMKNLQNASSNINDGEERPPHY